jgi:hypothetical protein
MQTLSFQQNNRAPTERMKFQCHQTELSLAYRDRVVKHDDVALRIARTVKEDAEAIQAVMLKAPKQVRLKEISEKIVASFYLDGPDSVAPLMAMVTTMLGTV